MPPSSSQRPKRTRLSGKVASSSGPPDSHAVQSRTLLKYIDRFHQARVLVIGDLILDHYIWGTVNRISPEAPVPVVHVDSESFRLGGAANVYQNILSLAGQADVCGVVGADEGGQALLKELGSHRRSGRGGIILDQDRPTTRKTRILANSQQIVRYDREQHYDVPDKATQRMLRYVQSRLPEVSCLVVSDYAKGVVTSKLMRELCRLASLHAVPLVVDPKVAHFSYFSGVTVMTPNQEEAIRGIQYLMGHSPDHVEPGHVLRDKLGCDAVLVTRGGQGMTLCEGGGRTSHISTVARQVYDVTGAGDTVVATMALALSTGASIYESAVLANHAAGQVVGMVGTASLTPTSLKDAVRNV